MQIADDLACALCAATPEVDSNHGFPKFSRRSLFLRPVLEMLDTSFFFRLSWLHAIHPLGSSEVPGGAT